MKKYVNWTIELAIWGLLLFSIFFVGYCIYNKNIEEKSTYYVFFHDVDGIIKGSPVKIQGYQVGYVSGISLVNDEVFVKFVITEKNFVMPQNLLATVEFTGMGGSKSLELFVPDPNTKNNAIISTIEPHRINDFYNYQNQIARIIITMSSDFMNMFNENNTMAIKKFVKSPNAIRQTHKKLDEINNTEKKIIKRLNEYDKKQ